MHDPEVVAVTRRWFTWANEDMETAERLIETAETPPRHACWLAQQAAEKAVKTALVAEQIRFPFIHDLEELRQLIPPGWTLRELDVPLQRLTPWAIEARYPVGDDPTREDALEAVTIARQVVSAIAEDLRGRRLL